MVNKQDYTMHIAITTLPGYTPEEKQRLARALKEMAASVGVASFTVSVSVKDLPMEKWTEFIHELPDEKIIIPEADKSSKRC